MRALLIFAMLLPVSGYLQSAMKLQLLKGIAPQRCLPPTQTGLPSLRLSMQTDGTTDDSAESISGRRVVIVGAGWAGFGAARHLAKQGYQVTLLDGAEDPGGASSGIRSAQGKVVEAGIKGFWYQYRNIFGLLEELNLSDQLTDWTGSSFWSPKGLEVDAPVFQRQVKLPTPLGQFVHTLPTFTNLPVEDRLSLWRLAYCLVDYQTDYERYDSMSVADLMRQNGVSERLYSSFIRPLLLAMLFAPPEDLSAAVIIGTFNFLVLGQQANFDVRWCRGSISERIFTPLLADFRNDGGMVEGSRFVTDLEMSDDGKTVKTVVAKGKDGLEYRYDTDAVVFSVGVNAMKKLVNQIPALSSKEEFRKVMQLRSCDCIATRVWFDRRVSTRSPSNVYSGFDNDVGSTFFNLNDLQDEYRDREHGSVIASDFYAASSMLPLSDQEIVDIAVEQLRTVEPGFKTAAVIDYAVVRAPQCATLFSPGSYRSRPRQRTSIDNLFLCGDWIKETPMHGADGLSQERAYMTGLKAANLLIRKQKHGMEADVLQVDDDEQHIVYGKTANILFKQVSKMVPNPLF